MMRIPREVRERILDLCLVVDGVVNPHPAHYEDENVFHVTGYGPTQGQQDDQHRSHWDSVWQETPSYWAGTARARYSVLIAFSPSENWKRWYRHLVRHLRTSFDFRLLDQETLLSFAKGGRRLPELTTNERE
jgi:hypothetical protein